MIAKDSGIAMRPEIRIPKSEIRISLALLP
jgi:hypothetical protein